MVSGETGALMKAEGGHFVRRRPGQADHAALARGWTIFLNGSDMLAYQDGLQWDITMTRGAVWPPAGCSRSAWRVPVSWPSPRTAIRSCCGHPAAPAPPDPNATAWSGLTPGVKTDIGLQTLIGRSSGESFQLLFQGEGFVVLQP
ncbi:MAG: hypothetical protein WKH64_09290 [Chloroflexia bacterium]